MKIAKLEIHRKYIFDLINWKSRLSRYLKARKYMHTWYNNIHVTMINGPMSRKYAKGRSVVKEVLHHVRAVLPAPISATLLRQRCLAV